MDFVTYAVPFFLLLIFIELGWGIFKGKNTYRINDSLNSLSLGLLSTITKFVFLNIGLLVFSRVEQSYSIWAFNMESYWHWIVGILFYDFLYYWYHRISHERQLFWGSHVVHHQSEDYNLSTALRQTSTSFLTTWVFFVPCFFLGMPIYMYVSIATAHLVYQFWVHTQHIPKLGMFEWFMVTPSNHRVHHAQNEEYIDKNYGGLLIIWDRLFGTFQEEDERREPIYGIRTPLKSWNPLWANFHIFVNMARDSWRTENWIDKVKVLWARTGWRPEDLADPYPAEKADPKAFEKYGIKLSSAANIAIITQYFLISIFHLWGVQQASQLSYEMLWATVIAQTYTVVVIGSILDGKKAARLIEYSRLLVLSIILYTGHSSNLLSFDWFYSGAIMLLVSGALMLWCSAPRTLATDDMQSDLV